MTPEIATATVLRLFPTALSIEVTELDDECDWRVEVELADGTHHEATRASLFDAVRALWRTATGEDVLPSGGLTDGPATTASSYEPVTLRSLAAQVRSLRPCSLCNGSLYRIGMPSGLRPMPCPCCHPDRNR